MLRRVLLGSLRHRRAQWSVATLAVLLGATMVSALLNLSLDAGSQSSRELRAYGANLLLLPRGGTLGLTGGNDGPGIPERDLDALDAVPGVAGYVPYLYQVAEVNGQPVVVAGVGLDRLQRLQPPWRIDGRWPERPDAALVGVDAAEVLGLRAGDRFSMGFRDPKQQFVVAGLVEVGAAEDSQILISMPAAQAMAGRPGQIGLVQINAATAVRPLREVVAEIQARLPAAQVRTLRQLAEAEESVLARVRLLMALVAAAVLTAGSIALGSTMFTSVLERRTEIGLWKALGAADRQVAAIFLAEAASIGAVGGLAGYLAGLALAAIVGRLVFGAALTPTAAGLPATLVLAVGVALIGSLWPVRTALAIDPAVTLRGE